MPLGEVVRYASDLWEETAAQEKGRGGASRLEQAIYSFPFEVLDNTLTLGWKMKRWGEGLLSSAQSACAAVPAAAAVPVYSRPALAASPTEAELRDSLRGRGGICSPDRGGAVISSPGGAEAREFDNTTHPGEVCCKP